MAFNDYQFIRTKMSPSLEVFLDLEGFAGDGLERLILDMTAEGHKVSCRTLNEGHTYSLSITGGTGTDNQNLILSAFGDSFDECADKIQSLITLIDPVKENWHHIESAIKRAEKDVATILRDRAR